METMDHFDDEFYCLSKTVPLPQVSDNESNEQSVVTMSHYGSMFSMENSDMDISSLISSFTSSSKEHIIVSQDEFGPDPRQEESGKRICGFQDTELLDMTQVSYSPPCVFKD